MSNEIGGPIWKAIIVIALLMLSLFALWTFNAPLILLLVIFTGALLIGEDHSLPRRLWEGNF